MISGWGVAFLTFFFFGGGGGGGGGVRLPKLTKYRHGLLIYCLRTTSPGSANGRASASGAFFLSILRDTRYKKIQDTRNFI